MNMQKKPMYPQKCTFYLQKSAMDLIHENHDDDSHLQDEVHFPQYSLMHLQKRPIYPYKSAIYLKSATDLICVHTL